MDDGRKLQQAWFHKVAQSGGTSVTVSSSRDAIFINIRVEGQDEEDVFNRGQRLLFGLTNWRTGLKSDYQSYGFEDAPAFYKHDKLSGRAVYEGKVEISIENRQHSERPHTPDMKKFMSGVEYVVRSEDPRAEIHGGAHTTKRAGVITWPNSDEVLKLREDVQEKFAAIMAMIREYEQTEQLRKNKKVIEAGFAGYFDGLDEFADMMKYRVVWEKLEERANELNEEIKGKIPGVIRKVLPRDRVKHEGTMPQINEWSVETVVRNGVWETLFEKLEKGLQEIEPGGVVKRGAASSPHWTTIIWGKTDPPKNRDGYGPNYSYVKVVIERPSRVIQVRGTGDRVKCVIHCEVH